jgi:hypothetical protein
MKNLAIIMKQLHNWCDEQPTNMLLGVHLAISSLGVIGAFFGLKNILVARYGVNWVQQYIDSNKYFDWLRPYFFPTHKYVILGYGVAIMLLGLLLLIMLFVNSNHGIAKQLSRRMYPGVYLVDIACVSLSLIMVVNGSLGYGFVFGTIGLWLACMFAPLLSITGWKTRLLGRLLHAKTLLLFFSLLFVLTLRPFASGDVIFFNDYFGEIPTYTWVRSAPDEEPRLVDTIQYINEHRIWGHQRYDPRVVPGEDPECFPNFGITTQNSKVITEFAKARDYKFYKHHPSGALCFVGQLTEAEIGFLQNILTSEAGSIALLGIQNKLIAKEWANEPPIDEVFDFIRQNNFEISQSLDLLEGAFHHHFQLLNPIKELYQGRSLPEIVSPYGLSFMPIYAAMKVFGQIDYPTFLKVVFSSYYIYLLVFGCVTWIIFRDLRYVAVLMLTKMGCIQGLGYVTLFTGLGYSPVRHFHDILLILFVFLYLKSERQGWLWGALLVAAAGLFLDRMLGSFGVMALLAILIVKWLNGHRTIAEMSVLVMGVIAFPILFFLMGQVTAPNPYLSGFLDGVWGFPISTPRLIIVLFFLLLAHAAVVYLFLRLQDKLLYLSLFLLVYAELLVFYWLTIPNYGHLFQLLPFVVFFGVFVLRHYANGIISQPIESKFIWVSLVFSALFCAYGALNMMSSSLRVDRNADTHKVFNWPFERAKIRSTMDPQLFTDAVSLIGRWNQGKGAFIISQYDTLLLYLADKHNLSPHFDLVSYLSGPKALKKATDSWRAQRPELLLVDTCIECSLQILQSSRPGILQVNPAQYDRISEKIDRLKQLKKLFQNIESEYELVERGALISVYRLKSWP